MIIVSQLGNGGPVLIADASNALVAQYLARGETVNSIAIIRCNGVDAVRRRLDRHPRAVGSMYVPTPELFAAIEQIRQESWR